MRLLESKTLIDQRDHLSTIGAVIAYPILCVRKVGVEYDNSNTVVEEIYVILRSLTVRGKEVAQEDKRRIEVKDVMLWRVRGRNDGLVAFCNCFRLVPGFPLQSRTRLADAATGLS